MKTTANNHLKSSQYKDNSPQINEFPHMSTYMRITCTEYLQNRKTIDIN